MSVFQPLMTVTQRIAILDLGTNSIRFDVHRVHPTGQTELLKREKAMVRLGEGVFLSGRLNLAARARTLEALRRFRRIADDLGVPNIVAFATATLREAEDAPDFVKEVRRVTGIALRIISGEEEAKLIAEGILAHEKRARGRTALIDIGGGSTEVTICRNRHILHCTSFPLGVARLQQVFLKSIPPRAGDDGGSLAVDELRQHIRSVLLPTLIGESWPRVKRIVGSSGSIRALTRIAGNGKGVEHGALSRLITRMIPMQREELERIPGMEPKRIDPTRPGPF